MRRVMNLRAKYCAKTGCYPSHIQHKKKAQYVELNMIVDIGHLVEVSFDGVGGAALIAFITALYERRRKAAESVNTPTVAAASEGRLKAWIFVAGAVFVVSLVAGAISHFSSRTSLPSVPNSGIEPVAQKPRNEPHGEASPVRPQPPTQTSRKLDAPPNGLPTKRIATTADGVIALVAAHFQVDRAKIKPEDDLILDLGGEPLDVAEIVMSVESSYDIEIPTSDVRKLKSVGDIINYVEYRTRETSHPR